MMLPLGYPQQLRPSMNQRRIMLVCLSLALMIKMTDAFVVTTDHHHHRRPAFQSRVSSSYLCSAPPQESSSSSSSIAEETVTNDENEEDSMDETNFDVVMKLSALDIKARLLDLVPRMMGTADELMKVQNYINAIEQKYMPPLTLDWFNMATAGDWQLLFSTSSMGRPLADLRLTEMYQNVDPHALEGNITNTIQWNYAQQEDDDGDDGYDAMGSGEGFGPPKVTPKTFNCFGTFQVKCNYEIEQGSRMQLNADDNYVLELGKGSEVPKDVPRLVELIERSVPTEVFHPYNHNMDTTYSDLDLRIIRMEGPKHEGTRNIFIRRGSFELNPTSSSD